jgi:hypothetical protein
MKNKKTNQVLTGDLREHLKSIFQKEIEKLPETLEGLEPKERLNVLCKMMPFILPKVESVHPTQGEPFGGFE